MEKMDMPVTGEAPEKKEEKRSADAIAMASFDEMGRMAAADANNPELQEVERRAADAMYALDRDIIAAEKANKKVEE